MALRRMFSKRITESARFLKMPSSSQNLYFHLGMGADDDGVVEAYPVMCMTSSTEDDLRVLVGKGFVTVLNDDLVVFLDDWVENNNIRADRKIDSIYKDLLLKIVPDAEIKEAKPTYYSRKKALCQTNDGQMTDNSPAFVSIGKDRLGKDRLGKDSTKKSRKNFTPPTLEEVKKYCLERKNNVDPEQFIDFYSSKDWMIGKNKMKDWKAAVRTWEQRDKKSGNYKTTVEEQSHLEKEYRKKQEEEQKEFHEFYTELQEKRKGQEYDPDKIFY